MRKLHAYRKNRPLISDLQDFVELIIQNHNNKKTKSSVAKLVTNIDNHNRVVSSEAIPELTAFNSNQELRTVLGAVLELRRQFHSGPVYQKRPFPGLRHLPKGMSASRFLRDEYADEIDSGRLGPGDLRKIDRPLYSCLADEAEAQKKTVSDLLKMGARNTVYAQRRQAVADIVGVPYEELSTFFSPVSDSRRQPNHNSERNR